MLCGMEGRAIPKSVGISMDGNRRWAKAKGLPPLEGHRAGYKKLREVMEWCKLGGIKNGIVYAFSTENWNRSQGEVEYLLQLFRSMIDDFVKGARANDIRIVFLGERRRFPEDIRESMVQAEKETTRCRAFTLGIALSYGGRSEIVDAVHRVPKEKRETITEEEFSKLLWTEDIPDPDIIIRTGGEKRLSNFLPWQSVYSELFFVETLWPDFSHEEFEQVLTGYAARERRFGA